MTEHLYVSQLVFKIISWIYLLSHRRKIDEFQKWTMKNVIYIIKQPVKATPVYFIFKIRMEEFHRYLRKIKFYFNHILLFLIFFYSQNSVTNLIGLGIILVLFIILRKSAWKLLNHIVPKNDMDKWSQIFFSFSQSIGKLYRVRQ